MTPNEAALLAAVLSALVSAAVAAVVAMLTTRYAIRHAPNYQERIDALSMTISDLAKTQEELRRQQAQQAEDEKERRVASERKAEAARWKPTATIESKLDGKRYVNRFLLKSPDLFRLLEVALLAPGGAKLVDFPPKEDWVSSTGFAVAITQDSLDKVAETSPTFLTQKTFEGSLLYRAQRDGKDQIAYSGKVPFHGKREYVQNDCSHRIAG